jgi:hypothetical protein
MPFPLIHALGNVTPDKAVEAGMTYAERVGVNILLANLGPEESQPALLTMSGVCRWLHGPRRIVEISSSSETLLGAYAPRFESLPAVAEAPWSKGLLLRLGREKGRELLVYVEPKEGPTRGIRYLVWMKNKVGWGTTLPKYPDEGQNMLETWTDLDRILNRKSTLGIAEDGSRLPLENIRQVCVNALAAIHEQPEIIQGERNAPSPRGKVGHIHRVRRLTLDFEGAKLVVNRWTTLDASKHQIEHSEHRRACMHVVQPHTWHVWTNGLREGEQHLEVREKRRKDGSPFLQFLVARLRGKDGPFTRGGIEIRPKEAKLVTGIDDI